MSDVKRKLAIGIAATVLPWVFYATLPGRLTALLDVLLCLLVGASLADALTPLGLLNFCVLQWFGVRLVRRAVRESLTIRNLDGTLRIHEERLVTVGYDVLRWIWPLTGWWTDYRWVARRT